MRQAGDTRRAQRDFGWTHRAVVSLLSQDVPPTCGLEINLRRLKGNRNVRVMTMTEVVDVKGRRGDYTVTLKISPR